MQKAYGIAAKDISSRTRVSVKSSSGAGDGSSIHKTAVTNATSQRLRNSTGATHSSTKPENTATSRRSLPPGGTMSSKSSSKIIAASKANYAEKYGSTKSIIAEEHQNKVNSMASPIKRSSNNNNSAINGGGTSSPYKNKTVSKSSPKV